MPRRARGLESRTNDTPLSIVSQLAVWYEWSVLTLLDSEQASTKYYNFQASRKLPELTLQWYIFFLCGFGYLLDLMYAQAFGLVTPALQNELGFPGTILPVSFPMLGVRLMYGRL